MQKLLLIACAGALGTLARYSLSALVQNLFSGEFPWGTFAVNIAGAFLFGLVWTLAEERLLISGETRIIILSGFMGAFTTFSTFMFETGELLRDAEWLLALSNLIAQNGIGILALFLGIAAGRLL